LLKTGFFRQVRELKIQRKNPGGAFKGRLIKEEREECKISMNVGPLKPTSFLFLTKLAASCNRFIVGHE
jgi:hypothetical protein